MSEESGRPSLNLGSGYVQIKKGACQWQHLLYYRRVRLLDLEFNRQVETDLYGVATLFTRGPFG